MTAWNKGGSKSPGSGRKKGTPNKSTVDVKKRLEDSGCDVFGFLVATVENDKKTLGLKETDGDVPLKYRIDAARELAQYIAPKLKAIDFTSDGESVGESFAAAVDAFHGKLTR